MPSFTQEQYDALVVAIATGTKTVKYADKEVTYRTLSEMINLKDLIAKDLGIVPDGNRNRRVGDYHSGF